MDGTEDEGGFYGTEGTLQWMAPEVMSGGKYNSRVDMCVLERRLTCSYSYGILLTELLARIVPFSDTYADFDFINDVIEHNQLPTIPKWWVLLEFRESQGKLLREGRAVPQGMDCASETPPRSRVPQHPQRFECLDSSVRHNEPPRPSSVQNDRSLLFSLVL